MEAPPKGEKVEKKNESGTKSSRGRTLSGKISLEIPIRLDVKSSIASTNQERPKAGSLLAARKPHPMLKSSSAGATTAGAHRLAISNSSSSLASSDIPSIIPDNSHNASIQFHSSSNIVELSPIERLQLTRRPVDEERYFLSLSGANYEFELPSARTPHPISHLLTDSSSKMLSGGKRSAKGVENDFKAHSLFTSPISPSSSSRSTKTRISRSLSSPFFHSWQYGNIDVASNIRLSQYDTVKSMLFAKWQHQMQQEFARAPRVGIASPNAIQLQQLTFLNKEQTKIVDSQFSNAKLGVIEIRMFSTEVFRKELLVERTESGKKAIAGTVAALIVGLLDQEYLSKVDHLETVLYTHSVWMPTVEFLKNLFVLYEDGVQSFQVLLPETNNTMNTTTTSSHRDSTSKSFSGSKAILIKEASRYRVMEVLHAWIETCPEEFSPSNFGQSSTSQTSSSVTSINMMGSFVQSSASAYESPHAMLQQFLYRVLETGSGVECNQAELVLSTLNLASRSFSSAFSSRRGSISSQQQQQPHPSSTRLSFSSTRSFLHRIRSFIYKGGQMGQINFVDIPPKLFALQLTLFDSSRIRLFNPSNLIHLKPSMIFSLLNSNPNWNSLSASSSNVEDNSLQSNANPNLEFASSMDPLSSNQSSSVVIESLSKCIKFSGWVTTEIVTSSNLSERIIVLSNFIDIAYRCYIIRNFNSCYNIYAGIKRSAVTRLTETWHSLSADHQHMWSKLSAAMASHLDFFEECLVSPGPKILPIVSCLQLLAQQLEDLPTLYQNTKTSNSTSAKHQSSSPTPTESEASSQRNVPMVNFSKLRGMAQIIKPFIESKRFSFPFDPCPEILDFFDRHLFSMPYKTLFRLSLELEFSGLSASAAPKSLNLHLPKSGSKQNLRFSPPGIIEESSLSARSSHNNNNNAEDPINNNDDPVGIQDISSGSTQHPSLPTLNLPTTAIPASIALSPQPLFSRSFGGTPISSSPVAGDDSQKISFSSSSGTTKLSTATQASHTRMASPRGLKAHEIKVKSNKITKPSTAPPPNSNPSLSSSGNISNLGTTNSNPNITQGITSTGSSTATKESTTHNSISVSATSTASSISDKPSIPVFASTEADLNKEKILRDLQGEIRAKCSRPLAQCSVGQDLPRFVRKCIVLNESTGEVLFDAMEPRNPFNSGPASTLGSPTFTSIPNLIATTNSTSTNYSTSFTPPGLLSDATSTASFPYGVSPLNVSSLNPLSNSNGTIPPSSPIPHGSLIALNTSNGSVPNEIGALTSPALSPKESGIGIDNPPNNANNDSNNQSSSAESLFIQDIHDLLKVFGTIVDSKKEQKAIEKSFELYFGGNPAKMDLLKETDRFCKEILGETSRVTMLLKSTFSQGVISPAWMKLRLFILSRFPFKDVKKGWNIAVLVGENKITVVHRKREVSNEEITGYPDFEFTWEMKIVFSRKMEKMEQASFAIVAVQVSPMMNEKKLNGLKSAIKDWFTPSSDSFPIEFLPPKFSLIPNSVSLGFSPRDGGKKDKEKKDKKKNPWKDWLGRSSLHKAGSSSQNTSSSSLHSNNSSNPDLTSASNNVKQSRPKGVDFISTFVGGSSGAGMGDDDEGNTSPTSPTSGNSGEISSVGSAKSDNQSNHVHHSAIVKRPKLVRRLSDSSSETSEASRRRQSFTTGGAGAGAGAESETEGPKQPARNRLKISSPGEIGSGNTPNSLKTTKPRPPLVHTSNSSALPRKKIQTTHSVESATEPHDPSAVDGNTTAANESGPGKPRKRLSMEIPSHTKTLKRASAELRLRKSISPKGTNDTVTEDVPLSASGVSAAATAGTSDPSSDVEAIEARSFPILHTSVFVQQQGSLDSPIAPRKHRRRPKLDHQKVHSSNTDPLNEDNIAADSRSSSSSSSSERHHITDQWESSGDSWSDLESNPNQTTHHQSPPAYPSSPEDKHSVLGSSIANANPSSEVPPKKRKLFRQSSAIGGRSSDSECYPSSRQMVQKSKYPQIVAPSVGHSHSTQLQKVQRDSVGLEQPKKKGSVPAIRRSSITHNSGSDAGSAPTTPSSASSSSGTKTTTKEKRRSKLDSVIATQFQLVTGKELFSDHHSSSQHQPSKE